MRDDGSQGPADDEGCQGCVAYRGDYESPFRVLPLQFADIDLSAQSKHQKVSGFWIVRVDFGSVVKSFKSEFRLAPVVPPHW
jgi:hypothetical protein